MYRLPLSTFPLYPLPFAAPKSPFTPRNLGSQQHNWFDQHTANLTVTTYTLRLKPERCRRAYNTKTAGNQIEFKEIAPMSKAMKYAEKAAVYAALGAWVVYERLNRISPNPGFTPSGAKNRF